jgi:arylsulfatase A-like enzyme
LKGERKGPLREATVHHSIDGSFAIRKGRWKLIEAPHSGGWSSPRPRDRKDWADLPSVQLYDLSKDPGETKNVALDQTEVVGELQALLKKYRDSGRSVRRE